ncbi:DUF305 domain-containing protein [Kribbella sp. NPDC023855]|uniref:DUF305 domain-containing protein n=1 Tax=Kribbella sp. NPDC023855 TaxID=3154698 RepID=UPI0033CAB5FE
MRHHLWKSAALILLSGLVLAGCGHDTDGGSPASGHGAGHGSSTTVTAKTGDFNDADATFAAQMIPHHRQALQMTSMAGRKATTAEVKKLSAAMATAQQAEITTLSGWLTDWGKPVPTPAPHDDHNMTKMPGMMTEAQMSDLGNATGPLFDRMWAQMMIEHHQGAVVMAKTEQTAGKNAAAIALAQKIETDQNAEIATMRRLLGRIPAN